MKSDFLIDTHCHLNSNDNIDDIIERAINNNVLKIIISGCDLESIEYGLKIINKYPNIYMTIGIHPDAILEYNDQTINYLEKLILENKKIIGIGEIGLDYYHNKDNKDNQKKLFIDQLELAKKLDLPVVIHTRDALLDTYNILKNYNLKGIIHCFSGSLETAKLYVDLGYYLGIGGVSTFKNTNLKETLKFISLDNIVFETDSPYLTPEPFRGMVNEPKNIDIICDNLVSIKQISKEEIIKRTSQNVYRLFNRFE